MWHNQFSELPGPLSAEAVAELTSLLSPRSCLFGHYQLHDGGIIENSVTYLRFFPISEIIEVHRAENLGWPANFLFFASNGGGEGLGVFLDRQPETYFTTQWIADVEDVSVLGDFKDLTNRIRTGRLI